MTEGRKVLVLAADLFEDMELLYPVYRLREEEVEVTIAGLSTDRLTGPGVRTASGGRGRSGAAAQRRRVTWRTSRGRATGTVGG